MDTSRQLGQTPVSHATTGVGLFVSKPTREFPTWAHLVADLVRLSANIRLHPWRNAAIVTQLVFLLRRRLKPVISDGVRG